MSKRSVVKWDQCHFKGANEGTEVDCEMKKVAQVAKRYNAEMVHYNYNDGIMRCRLIGYIIHIAT